MSNKLHQTIPNKLATKKQTVSNVKKRECSKCKKLKTLDSFTSTEKRCRECVKAIKANPDRKRIPRPLDTEPTDSTNFDWQGGKPTGTIFKNPEETSLIIRSGTFPNRFERTIAFNKFNSEAEAYAEAEKIKKEFSDKLFLTKNMYKLVPPNEGEEIKYVIVQITQNYCTLIDIDKLDIIKSYTLERTTTSQHKNFKSYCCAWDSEKLHHKPLHKMFTGYEMTDHINRYPLDNRMCNLRSTNPSENNKNKTFVFEGITFFDKNIKKYVGQVGYYHNKNTNNRKHLSESFHIEDDAKAWVKTTRDNIDKEYMAEEYYAEALRKEYEAIMTDCSEGFKWQDIYKTENEKKDKIIEEQKIQNSAMTVAHDKKYEMYDKFKTIDPNFDPESMITPGGKQNHIFHANGEYKYCSKCIEWKLTNEFPKNISNGGVDKRCKNCKYKEARERKKAKYLADHPDIVQIPCPICGEGCNTPKGLTQHINDEHKSTEPDLTKPFSCSICGDRFKSQSGLKSHITTIHKKSTDQLEEQVIQEQTEPQLVNEPPKQDFVCTICGKVCKNKGGLTKHIKLIHKNS